MCQRTLVFWFCAFLLTVLSLSEGQESLKNFTNVNELSVNANQNDSTRLAQYNLHDNFSIDTMSNEGNNFTRELRVKFNKNDENNNIVSYKECDNTCQLIKDNCVFWQDDFFLLEWPNVTSNDVMLETAFKVIANATCKEGKHFWFNNYMNDDENAMFFDNATSLHQSRHDVFISRISNCLVAEYRALENDNATFCDFTIYTTKKTMWMYLIILFALTIISSLCLLMTFIVYSICSELRNLHGYALRSYIFSFFVIYNLLLGESIAIYNGINLEYFSCLGMGIPISYVILVIQYIYLLIYYIWLINASPE